MRAADESVLTSGFLMERTNFVPSSFLLPAFTRAVPARIGMLGIRIQLQQRNCFRFPRNSIHQPLLSYSRKELRRSCRALSASARIFCQGEPRVAARDRAQTEL